MFTKEQLSRLEEYNGPITSSDAPRLVLEFITQKPIREMVLEESAKNWNHPDIPYPIEELYRFINISPMISKWEIERVQSSIKDEFDRGLVDRTFEDSYGGDRICNNVFDTLFPKTNGDFNEAKRAVNKVMSDCEKRMISKVKDEVIPLVSEIQRKRFASRLRAIREGKRLRMEAEMATYTKPDIPYSMDQLVNFFEGTRGVVCKFGDEFPPEEVAKRCNELLKEAFPLIEETYLEMRDRVKALLLGSL